MASTYVQKWGNSLAVRIPQAIAKQLSLSEGTPVNIVDENNKLTIVRQNPKDLFGKDDWKKFVIPNNQHHPEAVSQNIDKILYGN